MVFFPGRFRFEHDVQYGNEFCDGFFQDTNDLLHQIFFSAHTPKKKLPYLIVATFGSLATATKMDYDIIQEHKEHEGNVFEQKPKKRKSGLYPFFLIPALFRPARWFVTVVRFPGHLFSVRRD